MTRPPHWLTPNHRAHFPSRVVWYDVETSPEPHPDGGERHRLTFGWACYRRRHRGSWSEPEWLRFTDASTFWDWIESKTHDRTALLLLAHNAAYDATVLGAWRELPERDWTLKSAVYDSPPFIMTFRRGSRSLRLWDTLNWFRTSLAKVGERVGLAKLDRPEVWTGADSDDAYGKRDVEIIMRATLQWWSFLREHDLGGAAPTLAAQSLTAFRHKYLDVRILCDGSETALRMARDAYHGGRTECWRLGRLRGTWALLDIRSMYPYVMREARYPTILRSVYKRVTDSELKVWTQTACVVAECELDTDEPVYPFRADGRLIFPVGRFRATLSTPELVYALRAGHVQRVDRVAVYDAASVFRSFVDDIYALRVGRRDQGDETGAYFLKILMNSLYGKFGQVLRRDVHVGPAPDLQPRTWIELDHETGEARRMRAFAGQLHRLESGGESWWSHPAIAAHVTAYARLHLWRIIRAAGTRSVAYMDTDSVLVDGRGASKLRSRWVGDALGMLQVEGVYDSVELHGPKDYRMGSKRRTKGVRPSADWIAPDTVEQELWHGLRGLIQAGDVSSPRVERRTKTLKRRYVKGRVLPGGRVRPWRLPAETGSWR